METFLNIAPYLALLLVLAIVLVFVFRRLRQKKQSDYDVSTLHAAMGESNIARVEFVRGKVNVTLKDASKADLKAIKQAGALGVNLVGDKVKLYFEEGNEQIYSALKAMAEDEGESA